MILQHNMTSIFTNRQLGVTTRDIRKNTEKLASGYRINRAADDASGLAISEKMRSQIRGLRRASTNCNDGISMVQTADGSMGQMHDIMQRMRVLCVQAATDVNEQSDREKIQMEVDALAEEIDHITLNTEFNKQKVFRETYQIVTKTTNALGNVVVSNPVNSGIDAASLATSGLAIILNSDGGNHITTTGNMTEDVTIDYSTWVSTGRTSSTYFKATDFVNNTIITSPGSCLLPANYLIDNYKQGGVPLVSGKDFNVGGYDIEYTYTCEGPDSVPTKLTYTIYTAGTTDKVEEGSHIWHQRDTSGYAGLDGYTFHTAAKMDFSGLGTNYQATDLEGLGFNSSCRTCNDRYNVAFVVDNSLANQTTSGVAYKTERIGGIHTLYVDVSTITSGTQLTEAIVEAAKSSGFNDHYTQFAYDGTNSSTLYVYDNRFFRDTKAGDSMAKFEPIVREQGFVPHIPSQIAITTSTEQKIYTITDWYFQTGANSLNGIKDRKPILSAAVLGVDSIYLSDALQSSACITTMDNALGILSSEQSRMGALHNRLEYSDRIAQNSEENIQSSESLIRDTDMAEEMTHFSKNNILQQSIQSMLVQANSSTELVTRLLQ